MNQGEQKEMFKVFVGNLPYSFTEEELKEVFIRVGGFEEEDIVEVIILKEKNQQDPSRPPRSRGIGFVAFAKKEMVQQAIDRVNGAKVSYRMRDTDMERPIFVNEARPFTPQPHNDNRY